MADNTKFNIDEYTVEYRSNGGWTVSYEQEIKEGKTKGATRTIVVGYYSNLPSAMEGLLREKLTKLGSGTAKEVLERVRDAERRLRDEWTATARGRVS